MKKTRKTFGIAVIIAAIALNTLMMAGCPTPDGGGKTLLSIAVTTPPAKTAYAIGETLSTAGMVVTATYSDGTTAAVTGYSVSGFDSATAGLKTITVTYEKKTTSFTVTVNPEGIDPGLELTSIKITTQPAKIQYNLGEELETAGMVVTATYSGGATAAVTGYTTSGYDKNTLGNHTITVTYNGKTAEFTVNVIDPNLPTVATPTASVTAGTYAAEQSVTLTTTTADVKIYYTIDGKEPTRDSTLYSGAISVNGTTTLKAFAVKDGHNDSGILTAAYILQALKPAASIPAGTYGKVQSVTLTTTPADAKIYYTTDGTEPAISSTLYSGAIIVSETTAIKAVAVKDGWDDSGVLTVTYTIIIEMVSIQAGTFTMGQTDFATPEHSVTLTKNFYLGKYQVTQAQYQSVMGADENRATDSYGKEENHPVYYVSWYDALVFCNKWSVKEGLDPVYSIKGSTDPTAWGTVPTASDTDWNAAVIDISKNGYRLPTEAEWEYACRAGTTTVFNTGDTISDNTGWYGNTTGNSAGKTHEVGLKPPNTWELYDMHGNVNEWCLDWYDTNYYTNSPAANPLGASSGTVRVFRGGGWYNPADNLRSANRGSNNPYLRSYNLGFRLARTVVNPSLTIAVTPVASPAAGNYDEAQNVTLTSTTPDAKIYYTLDGTNPPYSSALYTGPISIGVTTTLKAVAVKEGMNDSAVLTATYILPVSYIITGSGASFTATQNSVTVGTANQSIGNVINAIRTDANGSACTIQFGDNATALDIGTNTASFNNTGGTWGAVTLAGKITGNTTTSATGTITIANTVSVTSKADITNTGSGGIAVYNNSSGALTFSGGTVQMTQNSGAAVYNASTGKITVSGTTTKITSVAASSDGSSCTIYLAAPSSDNTNVRLEILGGTVENTQSGSGASNRATAITNASSGSVNISGGTVQTTTTGSGGYTIRNNSSGAINISGGTVSTVSAFAVSNFANGTVNISGGTVQGTGADGYAVQNGTTSDSPATTGTINISGGTVQATGPSGARAVGNNSNGTVNISGGTVSSTNIAVNNYTTGKITVSQANAAVPTLITSSVSRGTYNNSTIAIQNMVTTATDARLEISGGTITNTADDGLAINNMSAGALTMSGGTVSVTGTTAVAIYKTYSGNITITGGTVSATGASGYSMYNNNANGTVTVTSPPAVIVGARYPAE
jgi:formylglycine-generating enzyme required for sulfatase activity